MQNLKQLSIKLNVDITTVYRHYKRLCKELGEKFTAHVTTQRGKLVFDAHAQYLLLNSFSKYRNNINENTLKLQYKVKETDYKSTINHLKDKISGNNNAMKLVKNNAKELKTELNEKRDDVKDLKGRAKDLKGTIAYQRKNINKLHKELDQSQIIADNAQKANQRKITNKKPSGFLAWIKRHI